MLLDCVNVQAVINMYCDCSILVLIGLSECINQSSMKDVRGFFENMPRFYQFDATS